ncbi:MAG: Nucleoside ABC transporter ATP-binding protein [Synergistales bacterium 53_16]|nr:MAG: Nucleoside ABC transporter ATP-binding protein [Synergistales bacterium 53_16]KUL04761.1 MAG: Nucleoside ABC transporter ATP-binding protein [Synergistales bacterium 54_9]HAG22246.1 heme ABC transporter ATP-binding protein [Synergistaceae bacterium]
MTNNKPVPVVEMRSIRKTFMDVVANNNVNFRLHKGEICALLGENGAGKTTLMNILFGYYAADRGEIFVKGKKTVFSSPHDAIRNSIGMVHQHFSLVFSQTVLENVVVGSFGGKFFLDLKEARKKLLDIQKRFGLQVDPDAPVWTLSVGSQQKVEILKALYREAEILILDEPTAVLAPLETEELFKTLRILAAEGRSVVFISHKLHEVMEISDRVVVLAKGEVVAERKTSETSEKELANLMIGREFAKEPYRSSKNKGAPLLEVRDLIVRSDKGYDAVKNISFNLHIGEITGLAGVSGNGQKELAEVLFGIREPEQGLARIGDEFLPWGNPKAAVDLGIGRIPEDRMTTGLILDLTVEENLVLENHKNFKKGWTIDYRSIRKYAEKLIRDFSIKTAGPKAIAKTLSGGNLQKIILARVLTASPRILVASQPTRGLDVGAAEYVHRRILEARDAGAAVLLVSEDLDEIFMLSDQIMVLYEGEIMGTTSRAEASMEQISLWMSGVKDKCA